MMKPKSGWRVMLPGGLGPESFTLDQLRAAKQTHEYLTEEIAGPEGIRSYIRGFRYLLFFGVACIAEDKYPPLTRCWRKLERLFMTDPAFGDELFVQSWILMDFPFGPQRQTALDYFEEFLTGAQIEPEFRRFIDEARRSRLGLHQDVMRSKKFAKFRELFTDRVISAFPSVEEYGKGEILLARTMVYDDQVFMFGNPKGFPAELKTQIEDMVLGKLSFLSDEGGASVIEQYERFMKLAGPYWMSCITQNDAVPVLDPDHYRSYLD